MSKNHEQANFSSKMFIYKNIFLRKNNQNAKFKFLKNENKIFQKFNQAREIMLYSKKFRFVFCLGLLLQLTGNLKTENVELKAEVQQKINNGIPQWMQKQISEDLFRCTKSGITKDMIIDTLKQDPMCVLFTIKNGKIDVEYNSQIPRDYLGGIGVMSEVLNELNNYLALPDVEFIYSVDDCPSNREELQSFKQHVNHNKYRAPVFGPCKHRDDINVVLVPGYQIFLSIRNNVIGEIATGNALYTWASKKNVAFWRGTTTGSFYRMHNFEEMPRVKLAKLSIDFPKLIDAKFNYFWEVDEETRNKLVELNFLGNTLPVTEHIQYKYQILIDGNSASWPRSYWQYQCNSVVFKQNLPYIVWHQDLFKPWIHYIPFDHDCNDLVITIERAMNNDFEAQKIAQAANSLAQECLKHSDLLVYFYAAITEYAKLQAGD